MASQLDIILRAIDKASGPIGGVTSSVGRLENASSGLLSRGLNPLTNALGLGIKAAVGIGVAALGGLTVAIGASIGKAADMQQRVADIAAVMGLAGDQIKPVSDLIQNLGLDPKLKVNATEAADAIEMLGKNGLSMDQILGGAARQTVLLANATGGDFATAANIATDVMSLFNIDAKDMQKAVNGISGVTIKSKFSVDDYRLAIAQAGGVAATVGVGFEDFNAVIAAIAPNFASGSDAGTSFKTMLQRLIPQSQDAEDLMRSLGLIAEDGSNQFYDASGNLKSMSEIIGILNRSFQGLTAEQRSNAFTTIFGTDAMRAAAAMINITQEQFDALRKSIADTDAEKQAATRMDTLSGSMEILAGIVDSLKIAVGQKFLPVFKDMVDAFTAFLNDKGPAIIKWAEGLATWLSDFVKTYFPPFLEKLGDWWKVIGDILTNLKDLGTEMGKWITKIGDFFKPITDLVAKFVTWNDVLVALGILVTLTVLPWLLSLVAAFAAPLAIFAALVLGVAAIRTAWQNNWGGIQEKVGAVLDYLNARFHLLWETITVNAPLALQEIWNWVTGNETSFTHLKQIWDVAKVTALALFKDLKDFVSANLPIWLATLKSWGGAIWKWISDNAPIAWGYLTSWGNATIGWVRDNAPIWWGVLSGWGKATWKWISDNAPLALAEIAKWGGAIWKWITDNAPTFTAKLGSWGVAIWQWIVDSTPIVVQKLVEWFGRITHWLINQTPTFGRALNDFFIGAFNVLGDLIPRIVHSIGDTLEGLMRWSSTSAVDGFKRGLQGLIAGAEDSGDNAGAALLRAFGNILVAIIEVAIQIGTAFLFWVGQSILSWAGIDIDLWKFYDHIKEITGGFDLAVIGRAIINGIKVGISAVSGGLALAFNTSWTSLVTAFNAAVGGFNRHVYEPIRGAVQRIVDGIKSIDLAAAFWNIWNSLSTAFNTAVGGFNRHVYEPVKAAIQRIVDGIRSIDLAAAFGGIWTNLVTAFNTAVGGFNRHVYEPIKAAIQRIVDGIRSIDLAAAFGSIWSGLVTAFNTASGAFNRSVWQPVHDFMQRIIDGIKSVDLFSGMWNALGRIVDGFNGWISSIWGNLWDVSGDIARRIIDGIKSVDLFSEMWNAVNRITEGFNGWLDGWWQNLWDRASDIGKNIINGIINGIDQAWEWLRSKLDWLGSIIPDWVKRALGIGSPSKVFIDIGSNLMQSTAQGIAMTAQLPQQALQGAAQGLITTGQQAMQQVANNTTNQFAVNFPNMGSVENPSQEAVRTMNLLTGVYA